MLTLNLSGFSALEALELMYAGLEVRHRFVTDKINELRAQIAAAGDGHASVRRPGRPPGLKIEREPAKRHHMSKASRQRIADAQQLRWKRWRREKNAKAKAETTSKAPKSRKIKPRTRREPQTPMETGAEA